MSNESERGEGDTFMSMKNDDDLFGGMFDLNGDGKTDLIEKSLEFHYLEEAAKETEESGTGCGSSSHRSRPTSAAVSRRPDITASKSQPQPESITREQYDSRISEFIKECILALFAFLILTSLPCIVMWAAADIYDPNDHVNVFVTILVFLVGIFFIVCFFSGVINAIRDSYSRMKMIRKKFEEQMEKEG